MQSETVSVTVDPQRTVLAFGKAFSGRNIVIQELLQNARRAGATEVNVIWDGATKNLVVEDDGSGIADFSALLGVAKSGWDASTVERESPYGLGFLATLFNCKRVRIESRGTCLDAETSRLLALEPVALSRSSRDKGTRVELIEAAIPDGTLSEDAMRGRCRGFPIPVILNGKPLSRDDAEGGGNGAWLRTDAGDVRLNLRSRRIRAYLQGFSVWTNGVSDLRGETVIHLDPRSFFGRLPDRDALIDREECGERIEKAVMSLAKREVMAAKFRMPADAFAAEMWDMCLLWECADLLNDVPFVHASMVLRHDGEPRLARHWGDDAWRSVGELLGPAVVFTKEQMASMKLCTGAIDPPEAVYLLAHDARLIRDVGRLDSGHWVHEMVVRLPASDEPAYEADDGPGHPISRGALTITPTGYRCATSCEVDGYDVDVWVCESIAIHGPLGEVTVPPGIGVGLGEAHTDPECLIIATPQTWDTVVRQISSHQDSDHDTLDEDAESTSEGEFRRALAVACGESPAGVLTMLLAEKVARWSIPAECCNRSYRLDISEAGEMNIVQL